ncbi:hypothetical protein L4C36_13845 [Photobacterium japonica]|uniref:hypothetical protein n=1 Tax=Photobacterium japonica TaxID=2910235 RepID=UPI003D12B4C6
MNIKNQLHNAPRNQIDNVAQNIVSRLSNQEIKSLSAENILRLYEALALKGLRIVSTRDKAAIKKLSTYSSFSLKYFNQQYAIDSVKQGFPQSSIIQRRLTVNLLNKIYAAETKRLSFLEKLGIDGKTIGRGQLGQPAFQDVSSPKYLKKNFDDYSTKYYIAKQLDKPLNKLSQITIRINAASKSGRSEDDTLKFAVALYHGMYKTIVGIQNKVNDVINWKPIEAELISLGRKDAVDYINEVVS